VYRGKGRTNCPNVTVGVAHVLIATLPDAMTAKSAPHSALANLGIDWGFIGVNGLVL
jgi:hypothetical protein